MRGDRRSSQAELLQGKTQQAGNAVVEFNHFSRAIGSFEAKEDFVVIDAGIESTLARDFDFRSSRTRLANEITGQILSCRSSHHVLA